MGAAFEQIIEGDEVNTDPGLVVDRFVELVGMAPGCPFQKVNPAHSRGISPFGINADRVCGRDRSPAVDSMPNRAKGEYSCRAVERGQRRSDSGLESDEPASNRLVDGRNPRCDPPVRGEER